jgi:NAD(P)H-nitrite reductase large subunit
MSRAGEQQRIIVIGAGQAAAQLTISLRQGCFAAEILIVGAEPYLPYQRPPLSKKFLTERPHPDSLFLRPQTFWRDLGVDMVLGVAAASINPGSKTVTLADGRELAYGTLVLATGTRARALPLPGTTLANVFSLRAIGDVQRRRWMRPSASSSSAPAISASRSQRCCAARGGRSRWLNPRTACSSGSLRRPFRNFSI